MDRIPKGSLTMGPAESTSLPPGEQLLSTKRPVHSVRMRKDYGGPGPLVLQAEGRPREEGVDARKHIPLCKGKRFPSVQNQQIKYILSKSIVVSPTDRDNGKGRRRDNLAVIPSPTPRLV